MPRDRDVGASDVRMRLHRLYVWRLTRSPLRSEFHSRIAVDIASLSHNGWMADIGCGPGHLLRLIQTRTQGRSVGVDVDRRMLVSAKRERGIEVVQGTVYALPFRGGTLDLAVSSASIKDWGDRYHGVTEILRVLTEGGVALIYEFLSAGPGSHPPGFMRNFGLFSTAIRFFMRFARRFTLHEVTRLAADLKIGAAMSVEFLDDLGVVRIMVRKQA